MIFRSLIKSISNLHLGVTNSDGNLENLTLKWEGRTQVLDFMTWGSQSLEIKIM